MKFAPLRGSPWLLREELVMRRTFACFHCPSQSPRLTAVFAGLFFLLSAAGVLHGQSANATPSGAAGVTRAAVTIIWAKPEAIMYGTALSSTQLNASATHNGAPLPGRFTYSPAAGRVLAGGAHTLKATFTPADTTDYTTATASVTLQVNASTPDIAWATPAAITYGTELSGVQLAAKATFHGASMAGSFAYTPAKGTAPGGGPQTLMVTFKPVNAADYTHASASVILQVNPAKPRIAWASPRAITYGTPLGSAQLNATASVPGNSVYSPAAGTLLAAGTQTLSVTFTPTESTDYATVTATKALTVIQVGSTTAITATAPNPSVAGEAVTVSFTVTGLGVPTGSVTVTANTGESCSGTLSAGAGACSLTFATGGARRLTASYAGDTNFKSSSSAQVTQAIQPASTAIWQPPLVTEWQWQLSSQPTSFLDVGMYDIDLFDNDAATVDALHAQGTKAVCYIDVGTWEDWRPDAAEFPASVLGSTNGWPGERWLDIRRIDVLAPIMEARMDLCEAEGYDGVEPDNVDGYENSTGFPLTAEDQLTYDLWIAAQAHARALSVALKNDTDQVAQLEPYFDWMLDEQCFQYQECDTLTPFSTAGKAVFEVEYNLSTSQFCPEANALNFNAMKKDLALDAARTPCR
jgi:hypothetical protein